MWGLIKRFFARAAEEVTSFCRSFRDEVVKITIGIYRHAESIVILSLASIGLTVLLGEIPFYFALPAFIEAPLVIPVLSVFAIALLLRSIEWRSAKRVAV